VGMSLRYSIINCQFALDACHRAFKTQTSLDPALLGLTFLRQS
jgi:hypothetical protein